MCGWCGKDLRKAMTKALEESIRKHTDQASSSLRWWYWKVLGEYEEYKPETIQDVRRQKEATDKKQKGDVDIKLNHIK